MALRGSDFYGWEGTMANAVTEVAPRSHSTHARRPVPTGALNDRKNTVLRG